jgi:endonuclease/exonuclease/phosphatase family metal-dependent hydrolase
MRIVFDSNGSTGAVGNLSSVRFDSGGGGGSGSTGRTPYGGTAWAFPGTVQAEDFDLGGEGVAYHDATAGNTGAVYRSTDVDIKATSSGGYAIGWTEAGEWLKYTVNVASPGTYTLFARVASAGSGGTFHVEFSGVNRTGAMSIPNTGGWNTYVDVAVPISLYGGVQTMTVVFDSVGSTGAIGNLSYLRLESGVVAAPPPPPPPPPSGTGGRLRVMTWNIKVGAGDFWGQAQVMANSGAHVILLQEATLWNEYMPNTIPQRLQQLTGSTWYSHWAPHGGRYTDNEGTLILSRLPFVDKSAMNAYDRGFGRVLVSVGGVHVNVFNIHLDWYDSSLRSAQLEEFLAWSRQFGGPRIAGGDFNSWWGEYWPQRMESEYTDTWQDVTGSDEWGYTLNGAVRFDYLFRSRTDSWRASPTGCWVTQTGTSDHWPVIADYTIQ